MRRVVAWIVLVSFVGRQVTAFAAPADEAAANAASANIQIQGFVTTPSASTTVPGYTTSPPETTYYGSPNLSTNATSRVTTCAGSADPSCQATTNAIGSAVAPKPALGPNDPALSDVRDIANDPSSILGDVSGFYSGCTVTTVPTSVGTETKKCQRLAGGGNVTCSKKRAGEVTKDTSCMPGTWIPAGSVQRNEFDEMQVQALCEPTRADGKQRYRFYAHGGKESCIGWQTVDLPVSGITAFTVLASLSPHWEGSCWNPFYVAAAPSPGCAGGTCNFTFKFGQPSTSPEGAIVDVGPWVVPSSIPQPNGGATIAETWDDQCATIDANNGFGSCSKVSGPTCVDGPGTKTIQGTDVFAACWEYQSSYNCSSAGVADECAPLEAKGCTLQSSACIETLPSKPDVCGKYVDSYSCPKPASTTTSVSQCSPFPCSTVSKPVSPPVYDVQSCYNYLQRSAANECSKSLDVNVSWSCPAGSISGPTRDDAPPGAGTWTCTQTKDVPYCAGPLTGPSIVIVPPNAQANVCTDPASGEVSAAGTQTIEVIVPAVATEQDVWANGCAALEARVPLGRLPADGVNVTDQTPVTGGILDKCQRIDSTCAVAGASRVINDHSVSRSCWGFTNSFDCMSTDGKSDCGQPRFGECSQQGDPICVDSDQGTKPPTCTAWRTDFQCKVRDAVYNSVTDCGAEQPSADADFARSIAFLEAGREAGRYLDPATMRVFKGADNRCDKRLWGLTNCCNRAGAGSGSLFTNANLASTAVAGYKAAFSTYTYDALFVSDAPTWVVSAFETLAGGSTGFSSAIAGVISGDVSFMSFLSSLSVFTWIAIIIFIIQISGILDCPESAQVTAMKREARLCTDIGEYCSHKSIFGSCMTRTRTHCCFNSRLSRIINEQGRVQLGLPWGSPESPYCDGFTIEQLQKLNFALMDLSEFYADIVPTMPDLGNTIAKQQGRVSGCYYGQGKCAP